MAVSDSARFAALTQARRVWAVAAIHGEAPRLKTLHDQLQYRFRAGDRLVYLGNMIGRGKEIIKTVDELLEFRRILMARFRICAQDIVYLRGSQEEMWQKLLQLHFAESPAKVLEWMLAHGVDATLGAYGASADSARMRCREGALALARWTGELRDRARAHQGHESFMVALRRAAFQADGPLLFVHTGIDMSRPLSAQADSFWWGGADFNTIDQPFDRFDKIVRGYDPDHRGPQDGRHFTTIDGGCGFGGTLRAQCFASDGTPADVIEA